jgi:hypothetical protein
LTGGKTSKGATDLITEHYSWRVINDTFLIKKIDKSFYYDNNTGVPQEILDKFGITDLKVDSNRILVRHRDKVYELKLSISYRQESFRGKITWRNEFQQHFQRFVSKNYENDMMLFHENGSGVYDIEFLNHNMFSDAESEIESDLELYCTIHAFNPKRCIKCNRDLENDPVVNILQLSKFIISNDGNGFICPVCQRNETSL